MATKYKPINVSAPEQQKQWCMSNGKYWLLWAYGDKPVRWCLSEGHSGIIWTACWL